MLIPLTQVEASCRHFSRPIGGKSSGRRHFRSTSERYLSQREKHFSLNSEKPPKASEVPEPRQLLWGCGWAQASVQTAGVSRGSQAEKGVREAAGVSRKSGVSPPASRDQPPHLQDLAAVGARGTGPGRKWSRQRPGVRWVRAHTALVSAADKRARRGLRLLFQTP